ncbi:hypothetical protein Arub01_28050 [Actinomadura rubrobrunea]|uniref:DUF4265 domain-containing protein n=1 Tax=Actinomadura rubrobrunea TaxID=115335 RepID=A0A9W6UUE7_9ACTN|nr:DUF4265 domain-containing protein [Actinomadura rubrobrunea]GLW64561.1 hypothetical protein Arub01_28050 [Actinomadura rubrobrunea]
MTASQKHRPPQEAVRVVFELPREDDDWPPAASERVWAFPVAEDRAEVANIPFFVRGIALGDVVRTEVDDEGVLWGREAVQWSDNCTIRVTVFRNGALAGDRRAVLDMFAPLGVEGEGIAQTALVALNVPPTADLAAVRDLLRRGRSEGWWDYEESCTTPAWRALGQT